MALEGIKVLELAGLAPVPFAGMILADFGAKVVRIDRLGKFNVDTMGRGKRSICVDLKRPEGVEIIKKLCKNIDVIIEPFRPGVMERLGIGPEVLTKENQRLVYARLNGFGQSGPYRNMAGHDINYIATSGILSYFCRKGERPYPPINIVADLAGGGQTCAFGVLAALFERERSGKGQVVNTSMVEGSAYVSTFAYSAKSLVFTNKPGNNLLDTGAPFYDCYTTKDKRHVAIGAVEPQFFEKLVQGLGLNMEDMPPHMNPKSWPQIRKTLEEAIASHTMQELSTLFDGTDACLTPVLTPEEAAAHPHNRENGSFFETDDGVKLPAPAPKLSRTAAKPDTGPQPVVGKHTAEVLLEHGFTEEEITELQNRGVINV